MLKRTKTTLTLKEKVGGKLTQVIKVDMTEDSSDKYLEKIVALMRSQGYHDVAILRSLRNAVDQQVEYMESIVDSKGDWYENDSYGEEDD